MAVGYLRIAVAIGLLACLSWRWIGYESRVDESSNVVSAQKPTTTRPIEQIRVGDRVMTSRVSSELSEPQWQSWVRLTAVMPMSAESERDSVDFLTVELMRPEEWVCNRVRFEPERPLSAIPSSLKYSRLGFAPIRRIFLDLLEQLDELESIGRESIALVIDLDLPELGAVGPAVVLDIDGYVHVADGPGDVVTATFVHPATTQVLDVTFASDDHSAVPESISVTESHPFWNAERNQFMAIGQMAIGQRVLTYSGDTQRIVSKLARPGPPQTVYNLEVYGQHFYCVGQSGLLVHNDCLRDDWEDSPRDRPSMSAHEARENGLSLVSGKSALIKSKPLSTSENHHIASPYRNDLASLFKSLGLNIRTHKQNLIDLDFHTGPHLPIYHEFVLRVLTKSLTAKEGVEKLESFNAALGKLGRFINRHKAIPNFFRL